MPQSVPAERAARCAAHPREPARITCSGCGLFLCQACAPGESAGTCARCSAEGHPVPWEDPSIGRLQALGRTLKLLTKPGSFFSTLPWTGGLRRPLAFAVITATLGAVGKGVFAWLSAALVGSAWFAGLIQTLYRPAFEALPDGRERLAALPGLLEGVSQVISNMVVSQVLTAPLEAALELFVLAALSHPVCRYLGGQGTFEGTFRALAYANAAQVLKLVPGIGIPFAVLGSLALAISGLRRAHGLTGGKALIAAVWWVPVAGLLFALFFAWVLALAAKVVLQAG